jgi:outer membrane protein TolC
LTSGEAARVPWNPSPLVVRAAPRRRTSLALLAALLLAATAHAQSWYRAPRVAPSSFANSSRVDALIRANQLYLSLPDSIAIALENNLDIELQRFATRIADTDLLLARGGGQLRGVTMTVSELPQSVIAPGEPLITSAAGGAVLSTSIIANVADVYPVTGAITNLSVNGSTSTVAVPFSSGPPIPTYDPAVNGQFNWEHQSAPQINPASYGVNPLVARNLLGNVGLTAGFSPGTQVGLAFDNTSESANATNFLYNPFTQSSLGLTVTQPLLRGFGVRLNRRFIRIAGIDQRIANLVFREQAIATVSGVIRLYYDLVSLNEDLAVKRQTLESAQRLYEDNQAQVEAGTLAPIEQTRAQAEVAAAKQDLITSEGFVLQQELLLKTVLTRRGTADPVLRTARIVPTSSIGIPAADEARPVDDLVKEALANRPEVAAAGLQIEGSEISLEGSRNELLPELNLVGVAQNSGLAAGGASALGQVLSHDYPTYAVGLQLNLPLRNRQAEADVLRDELQVRQSEVRRQQVENQVRLEIENALIALGRSREALKAATQARTLQEQSLELEREKFAVGLSTTFLITQYQSFLAQARSSEVAARSAWIKAHNALERAMGHTLDANGVSIDEAVRGQVSRPPDALPAQP